MIPQHTQLLQQNQVAALLARQSLTPWWVRGVLTVWPTPLIHQFEGVKPAFVSNSDYEAFILGLSIKGESVWQQLWVWRGLAPSPNQETGSEASSPQWVPWLHPWWLLSQGELVSIGWAPLGVASLGGIMGGSSRRAMPLNTSSSEKET